MIATVVGKLKTGLIRCRDWRDATPSSLRRRRTMWDWLDSRKLMCGLSQAQTDPLSFRNDTYLTLHIV